MEPVVGENHAVVNNRQEEVAVPGAVTQAWHGYLLVAAPALASLAGLVDGPGAAFFAYALLLLGVALIFLAMLPPRTMQRVQQQQQQDNRAVGNDADNHQEVPVLDSGTLAWSGYILVAASVAAACAGLADEPGAALSAYALLLLGVGFIAGAMFAPAKPKMA